MDDQIKRVKVKPYPIGFSIVGKAQPVRGQILRLTKAGALTDVGKEIFHIGEKYTMEFVVPVYNRDLKVEVRVVKVSDRLVEAKDPSHTKTEVHVQRYTEFQFTSLSEYDKKAILDFLTAIKQPM